MSKKWTVGALAVLIVAVGVIYAAKYEKPQDFLWETAGERELPASFGTENTLPETESTARQTEEAVQAGPVDINSADKKALMSLWGIGEVKAQAILDYRAEHGPFSSPEEVMRVPGIKEGTYARIRDSITALPPEISTEEAADEESSAETEASFSFGEEVP